METKHNLILRRIGTLAAAQGLRDGIGLLLDAQSEFLQVAHLVEAITEKTDSESGHDDLTGAINRHQLIEVSLLCLDAVELALDATLHFENAGITDGEMAILYAMAEEARGSIKKRREEIVAEQR